MADLDGLQPGPRDHLVTRALETLLERIGGEFREDVALDPAEGPKRLARHAMAEIARQLAAADETADEQVIRLNRLLRGIVPSEDDWAQTELVVPAKVLSGIKARSPLGICLPTTAAAGDAVQPERPARQRRGPAEYRLRAEG